ncbi:RING finger and CHY zinc finger domain containing protein 1 [Dissostichus eleginoides]|uniref:RING finger and CHY zinc finger domain containing protein 1 n=1 Tax=Dissostichus eleginoides TaxID=100907 RepID=A0AAD9F9C4_DISEL|nr:RING finger and CHY zinc finger domain containing protein 1 [Dissostichus eleginoides]
MASPVGCEHYVRSCLLKAPCCGKLYVCRLCHDAEENHEMDRFKVREVQCSECQTVQEAQQTCQQCNVNFGEYYCDICHLFDKNKEQYHCQPCGICRIGPREKQNCPVCMEDIHTSRIGAHVLPCGHLLHKTCFDDMVRTGAYRCPLCMHSACSMEYHWKQIDKEISLSPMPTEYQGATVKILCNDCQTHCTVPFHVLGMKCTGCGSYNTAQDGGLIQQQQGGEQQQQQGGEQQQQQQEEQQQQGEEEEEQQEEEEEEQQEEEEQEDIETDTEPEQPPTPH